SMEVSQSAISQIVTGKTQRSRLIPLMASKLSVNLDWLLGVTDHKIEMFDRDGEDITEGDLALARAGLSDRKLPFKLPPSEKPNTVELHEIDLAYGMGGTYLDDVPV